MGLAILPARLQKEIFEEVRTALLTNGDLSATETLASHAEWAESIRLKYDSITWLMASATPAAVCFFGIVNVNSGLEKEALGRISGLE